MGAAQRHSCLWDFPAEGQALNPGHGWYVLLKLLHGSLAAPPVASLKNQDLSDGDQAHCIQGRTPHLLQHACKDVTTALLLSG